MLNILASHLSKRGKAIKIWELLLLLMLGAAMLNNAIGGHFILHNLFKAHIEWSGTTSARSLFLLNQGKGTNLFRFAKLKGCDRVVYGMWVRWSGAATSGLRTTHEYNLDNSILVHILCMYMLMYINFTTIYMLIITSEKKFSFEMAKT